MKRHRTGWGELYKLSVAIYTIIRLILESQTRLQEGIVYLDFKLEVLSSG